MADLFRTDGRKLWQQPSHSLMTFLLTPRLKIAQSLGIGFQRHNLFIFHQREKSGDIAKLYNTAIHFFPLFLPFGCSGLAFGAPHFFVPFFEAGDLMSDLRFVAVDLRTTTAPSAY